MTTLLWRAALNSLAAGALLLVCHPLVCAQAVQEVKAAVVSNPQAVTPTPSSDSNANNASPMPTDSGRGEQEKGAAKKNESSQSADEKKKDESTPPASVVRPNEAPGPADAAELRVRPSEDGMIRFSFRNQPWPAVLQWLADVSNLSLDWQELPGDYLNLALHRSYTLPEARDLINRHLLARGYTMIEDGETLTVVNLSKLNPAVIPRVTAEELDVRQPHQFVRVSFSLEWMVADRAAEELKPMLSTHGKLVPLKETNRLEAMDVVANLREIHRLLSQEQAADSEDRLVREFILTHTRAADIRELLMELLGIESKAKGPASPLTPAQMQMMQQQAQMMQQQAQQQVATAHSNAKKDEISLVVNARKNSVLVTAPPDKMAIVAEAVIMLDVPASAGESLLTNMTRLQVYRLSAVDPDPIVKTLQEVGDLSPQTRLEVDAKNRAIIAYATLADHVLIRTMVEKLDGSARSLEVIPLRRLSADYVAGTLRFLLGGEQEKPKRRYPYYYYDQPQDDKPQDDFRVDADVENNRLLVWANANELEEVVSLLGKLGEIPQREGDSRRVRTIDIYPSQQTPEFFDRLEDAWEKLAPNPLRVEPTGEPDIPPPAKTSNDEAHTSARRRGEKPRHSSNTFAEAPPRVRHGQQPATPANHAGQEQAVAIQSELAEPRISSRQFNSSLLRTSAPTTKQTDAPVGMTRGPDGRLVISSEDTEALDLLEDLLREMAPRRKDFEVFELKYAPAFWVKLNLEDFFEDDDEKDSQSGYFRSWYWDMPPESEEKDPRRLSNRPPLKFISDDDTNTIVVQGADPHQLQTVAELIRLYDQAPPEDAQSRRVTQIFSIRYSRAEVIAEAVKDVYRDLLSANDKALAHGQQQQNQRPAGETYITNIGFGEEGDEQRERRMQVTFKGKLSIGVDTLTNTLLISTEGESLMRNIQEMILRLDDAARPRTTVEVLRIGGMGGSGLQKALAEIFRQEVESANGSRTQAGQPQSNTQPNGVLAPATSSGSG